MNCSWPPENVSESGKVEGTMKPTGMRPSFSPRLEKAGFKLSGDIFGANTMTLEPQRRR